MRLPLNRWFLLIFGILLGAIVGADFGFRFAVNRKSSYDQALKDHYIDSRIWNILTSTATLNKLDEGNIQGAIGDHELYLQGAFLALVDLHKTNQYPTKEEKMQRYLKSVKGFLFKRLEQKALPFKEKLEEGFIYADNLPVQNK